MAITFVNGSPIPAWNALADGLTADFADLDWLLLQLHIWAGYSMCDRCGSLVLPPTS